MSAPLLFITWVADPSAAGVALATRMARTDGERCRVTRDWNGIVRVTVGTNRVVEYRPRARLLPLIDDGTVCDGLV